MTTWGKIKSLNLMQKAFVFYTLHAFFSILEEWKFFFNENLNRKCAIGYLFYDANKGIEKIEQRRCESHSDSHGHHACKNLTLRKLNQPTFLARTKLSQGRASAFGCYTCYTLESENCFKIINLHSFCVVEKLRNCCEGPAQQMKK